MAASRMLLRSAKACGGGSTPTLVTGTYTGDGNPTKAIVGVGFQPKYLMIYAHLGMVVYNAYAEKSDQDGLYTSIIVYSFTAGDLVRGYEVDEIISLDADGFTVGDGTGGVAGGNVLNVLGTVYTYVAMR